MTTPLLAATPLFAAIAWTVALMADGEPWDGKSVLLIGVGLMTLATVGSVGVIVTGGRWAHRLSLVALAASIPIAIGREIDGLWWLAMVATSVALVALASPAVTTTIRKLPAATGPSPRAIAPALVLLMVPIILGYVAIEATTWAVLLIGLSAPVAAFVYSRVISGGLFVVRVLWPALAISMSPLLGLAAGIVSAALGALVVVLAWHPSVKASFHPPVESGTSFPIPPELAPSEILDAARIDDQGNPI